ncbi:MAG: type II secretion system major pseudopilin GspG [Planctomycetota bacterium]|nr:type II secretion system major pseudopilin GspG [Planctomycetota bacterium]
MTTRSSIRSFARPVARPSQARAGFTLVELLLVLVILAVLAAVILPRFTKRSEQSRITAATTDIASLDTAIDLFEVDTGRYPTTQEGLRALVEQPANLPAWKGPYLKRTLPNDPWGNAYIYRQPGQHNTDGYDLSSNGPNGQEGDTDDISNWTGK